MKKLSIALLTFMSITISSLAQTVQVNMSSPLSANFFFDSKFDPNDGGTVNVGYSNNAISGNDVLIVKLNAAHSIVWQKTIPNTGNDLFYRVIICSNGDYIAAGQLVQAGIGRAVACRFSPSNGNLIWTSVSANANLIGDIFLSVIETTNQNIVLVGYDTYIPGSANSFITLLNSSGVSLWSFISNRIDSDGFQAIGQLPNGNLVVAGVYIETMGNYDAVILELDETTGSVIAQNTYPFTASIPGGTPGSVNVLYPTKIYIKNNTVICQMWAMVGYGGPPYMCYFIYDQTTRNLSGNLLYHSGETNAGRLDIYPVTEADFLTCISFNTPPAVFVSRITNGTIVFNRKLNSDVTTTSSMDVMGSNMVITGASASNQDGYNLFSSIDIPASTSPCDIADLNNFFLINENVNAVSQNALILVDSGTIVSISPATQDPALVAGDVCGFVMPVKLTAFNAVYKSSEDVVLLDWTTSSEINSLSFIVERSNDNGSHYTAIGSVNAAGTSNNMQHYKLTDFKPGEGINLYRVKQTDIDGKFKYSDIRAVNCKESNEKDFILSPVPARQLTLLKYNSEKTQTIQISMFDAAGKLLKKLEATINSANPLKLDVSGWNAGVYFLKIHTNEGKIINKKLIVE